MNHSCCGAIFTRDCGPVRLSMFEYRSSAPSNESASADSMRKLVAVTSGPSGRANTSPERFGASSSSSGSSNHRSSAGILSARVMYELVERVYPVPPGFNPTQLGLSNRADPSTHGLLWKCLVSMCRVVSVRSYNHPHVTRRECVSHLVCAPEVRPEVRGMVGPIPLSWRHGAHMLARLSRIKRLPHLMQYRAAEVMPNPSHRPLPLDALAHRSPSSTPSMRGAHGSHGL